jgi:hypothetical protein
VESSTANDKGKHLWNARAMRRSFVNDADVVSAAPTHERNRVRVQDPGACALMLEQARLPGTYLARPRSTFVVKDWSFSSASMSP